MGNRKIRSDIEYVHSTTKNANPMFTAKDIIDQYPIYMAKFKQYHDELQAEHKRILSYYRGQGYKTQLDTDLGLLFNLSYIKDFDQFRYALTTLGEELYKLEDNKQKKWTLTDAEDGTYHYTSSSNLVRISTLEKYFNTIQSIGEKYRELDLDRLYMLAQTVKKKDGNADNRYVNSAITIRDFVTKELIPVLNGFGWEVKGIAGRTTAKEVIVTPQLKEFLSNWIGVRQKRKGSTNTSAAVGFITEPASVEEINNFINQNISNVLTVRGSQVVGQSGSLVDTVNKVGFTKRTKVNNRIIVKVFEEELRVQLKTGKWSSSAVLIEDKKRYRVNRKYGYNNILNTTIQENINLCNLYMLSHEYLGGEDNQQIDPDNPWKYLLSLLFEQVFQRASSIQELPSLVVTPDGYYWYDEFLESYWELILSNAKPESIYNFYVKDIKIPKDINEEMYQEKIDLLDKFKNKYPQLKQKAEKAGKDSPEYQEYYTKSGTYGRRLANYIKRLSIHHAIWSVARQKL